MQNSLKPEEILGLTRQFGLYEWSAQSQVNPLAVSRAKGVYFWTSDGKRYLDFNSQLMCVNIGHGDERVLDAIRAQLDQLAYVTPFITTEPRAILHKTLAELAPGNLNRSFFTLGGADANENAIKIARLFTGRHKIIARYRSYHGATAGALSLTGDPRRWPAEPGIPGVIHVQDPYEYRCRWCKDAGACNLNCLNHIEDVIQFEGPKTIAAIIMEPVTGTNGLIIPPDGYMAGVRSLCDKYGILFIADEVMSGFGRTGEWFAVNHWQVVPDLMTVAKGLTSAYVPLGAVIMKEEIASHFDNNVLSAGLTFNSHPVCCAAALATIDVYKQDKLIENARNMGRILGVEMEKLREKHPSVGDVRYIGLFSLFELVKNRQTREPMAPFNARADEMGAMAKLNKFFRDNGLYTFVRWNTFFANPPLCITESQLKEGLAIIDKGLEITDAAIVN
ncbi:MAG TPA: aminotransferase class III-fold pyridoxal phosphate-dependent enzyme [Candidatus Binataceae bacterium]|nr:aminotransferase class III-fold pyridoxal phosphate-dependent enzyme [Candidatus Binataceae bacterium]